MKKLLLLDADVVIDLHSLGFFEKMSRSYNLFLTREVLEEAKHYAQKVNLINRIRQPVTRDQMTITEYPASSNQKQGYRGNTAPLSALDTMVAYLAR